MTVGDAGVGVWGINTEAESRPEVQKNGNHIVNG